MRYNDRITFLSNGTSEYNPETGEFEEVEGAKKLAACMMVDLGLEKSQLLFGDYEKDRKVAYLQVPYHGKAERCEYKGKSYKVVKDRQSNTVLYLEGDKSL